jgi:TPR repeat protein
LEREGDRAGAKGAYRRADRRGHPEGACSLGLLLKDEGDHTGAVEAFQRAGERGSPEVAKVAHAALLELDPQKGGGR